VDWAFFPVFRATTQAETTFLLQDRFADPLAVHLWFPGLLEDITLRIDVLRQVDISRAALTFN
jgi:hypothetical protein